MPYAYYVKDQKNQQVPISVRPACKEDLYQTSSRKWYSDWTSDYLQTPSFELYAFEVIQTSELVALCAY